MNCGDRLGSDRWTEMQVWIWASGVYRQNFFSASELPTNWKRCRLGTGNGEHCFRPDDRNVLTGPPRNPPPPQLTIQDQ
jgi:hypothetical protein